MMIDEMIERENPSNITLKAIPMVLDKEIFLIRAKEEDDLHKKSYARSLLIMIGSELVTTNNADTKLLLSELKLFDKGNIQNKFSSVEQHNGVTNLKLKLSSGNIYISKAEALTIVDIYHESKIGISLQRLHEFELKFTMSMLVELLSKDGFLENKKN